MSDTFHSTDASVPALEPFAKPVVSQAHRQIALDLAKQRFGGAPREELVIDDESERRYVVVSVEMKGDPAQVIEQQLRWHEELERLIGDDEFHFRLSIKSNR